MGEREREEGGGGGASGKRGGGWILWIFRHGLEMVVLEYEGGEGMRRVVEMSEFVFYTERGRAGGCWVVSSQAPFQLIASNRRMGIR